MEWGCSFNVYGKKNQKVFIVLYIVCIVLFLLLSFLVFAIMFYCSVCYMACTIFIAHHLKIITCFECHQKRQTINKENNKYMIFPTNAHFPF